MEESKTSIPANDESKTMEPEKDPLPIPNASTSTEEAPDPDEDYLDDLDGKFQSCFL